MAKTQEKDMAETENVQSILGKIKKVVSGKEKVVIDDAPAVMDPMDEEPMELTEVVEEPAGNTAQNTSETQTAEKDISSAADEEEGNFVDILKEIDTALEKQYKEEQQVSAAPESAEIWPEPQAEPTVQLTAEPVQPPKAEEPKQEPAAEPVAEVQAKAEPEPAKDRPNANVAQEPVQNTPQPPKEAKKELAEDVSQNIMDKHLKSGMAENKPNILSEDIANKSSKAIQNLLNNIPRPDIDSPAFRSAITLEDVVMEMIKPMLKEWLDNNLEAIVRDIVEKEIKKIIPRD